MVGVALFQGATLIFLSQLFLSTQALFGCYRSPHGRSLNLANAASVVVYEAWRQTGFATS